MFSCGLFPAVIFFFLAGQRRLLIGPQNPLDDPLRYVVGAQTIASFFQIRFFFFFKSSLTHVDVRWCVCCVFSSPRLSSRMDVGQLPRGGLLTVIVLGGAGSHTDPVLSPPFLFSQTGNEFIQTHTQKKKRFSHRNRICL